MSTPLAGAQDALDLVRAISRRWYASRGGLPLLRLMMRDPREPFTAAELRAMPKAELLAVARKMADQIEFRRTTLEIESEVSAVIRALCRVAERK